MKSYSSTRQSNSTTNLPRTNALILPVLLVMSWLITGNLCAQNWPQWRGPDHNGISTATNLPVKFGPNENVLWKTALPERGSSTPILWDNHVILTSHGPDKQLLLMSFDRATGRPQWQTQIGQNAVALRTNNSATPSPATDGKTIFALFGTGHVAGVGFDGQITWQRNLATEFGKFAIQFLYGSSPLLYDGKLYIQVLQRGTHTYPHAADDRPRRDSYLLCLDAGTGRTLWQHIRHTDARAESVESYSTPILFRGGVKPSIVVDGADYVTLHDAATGDELHRSANLNPNKEMMWRLIASPTTNHRLIFSPVGRGAALVAFDNQLKEQWRWAESPPDVCTPLVAGDKLYVLDGDKQIFSCVESATGKTLWKGPLGVREVIRASPVMGDGKIYFVSEPGTVFVLEVGNEFKILNTVAMGEPPCQASIVLANGCIFIRTGKHLYAIGTEGRD